MWAAKTMKLLSPNVTILREGTKPYFEEIRSTHTLD